MCNLDQKLRYKFIPVYEVSLFVGYVSSQVAAYFLGQKSHEQICTDSCLSSSPPPLPTLTAHPSPLPSLHHPPSPPLLPWPHSPPESHPVQMCASLNSVKKSMVTSRYCTIFEDCLNLQCAFIVTVYNVVIHTTLALYVMVKLTGA